MRLPDGRNRATPSCAKIRLCLLFIHLPAHGSEVSLAARNTLDSARIPRASKLLICGLFQKGRVLAQDGMMEEVARCQPNGLATVHNGADDVGGHEGISDGLAHAGLWDGVFDGNLLIGFARFDSVKPFPTTPLRNISSSIATSSLALRSSSSSKQRAQNPFALRFAAHGKTEPRSGGSAAAIASSLSTSWFSAHVISSGSCELTSATITRTVATWG